MSASSFDRIKQERLSDLLEWALDTSLGTLWLVREDVWKQRLQHNDYDQGSTRRFHPGLSMRVKKARYLHEAVPMFHGTSYRSDCYCGPIHVRGLTREMGEDHITCFGDHIAPILMQEIALKDPAASLECCEGDMLATKKVIANLHKPRLNNDEMHHYKTWLKAKGLIHDEPD